MVVVAGAGVMLASYFGALPIAYGVLVALAGLYAGLRLIISVVRDSIEITDRSRDPKVRAKLLLGEEAIKATREHPVVILIAALSPWNLVAIGIGLLAGYVLGHGIALAVVGAILGYAGRLTWRIIVYRSDLLVLTNKRVFVASGPLSRSVGTIPIRNIGGTNVKIPLIARLLKGARFAEANFGFIVAQGIGNIFERFKYTPDVEGFERALNQVQFNL
jgi:hypothetical protein